MKKSEKARICQYVAKVSAACMLPYSASIHKGKKKPTTPSIID
jgi:hypothetical protein